MRLHRVKIDEDTAYAFFDTRSRLVETATRYMRFVSRLDRYSIASQRQLSQVLKQFLAHLEASPYFAGFNTDEAVEGFAYEHLVEWINTQRSTGVSECMIHGREILVKEMYTYLGTDDAGRLVQVMPWLDGKLITRQRTRTLSRYVTVAQVINLLGGLKSESQRAAVHFIFDTGVRISELCRLNRDALPKANDWTIQPYYPLTVLGSKGRIGDRIKARETVISHPMLVRVRKYHKTRAYLAATNWDLDDSSKPIFLSVNGERLTESGVQKAIASAAQRQAMPARSISPHRLRHGAAFSVLRSDLGPQLLDNLLILRGMLGHNQISTTEAYAHIPLAAILKDRAVIARHIEAQHIFDDTFLYPRQEDERRGHRPLRR